MPNAVGSPMIHVMDRERVAGNGAGMSGGRGTAAKTTAQILRDYRGPALFSFGFRPFFLFAAIWAALAVPLWIIALFAGIDGLSEVVTREWHVHEMLFGYAGAVIVGYMTVAGANWTGRFPVAGRPIAALLGLWIAGRAAMLAAGPYPLAVAVDAAFLILFALALWREQLAASNWRSVAPCIIVSLLAGADVLVHLRPLDYELAASGERMGIALITFLIVMMGGRLVPSFTRNWMAQRKIRPEPAPYGRFDTFAAGAAAAALAGWVLLPWSSLTAALLLVAGPAALIRLLRWRGWVAAREPLVWILHAGYAWVGIGLSLLGVSILLPERLPITAPIHALTAGAIGVMTLAMMTRTARSHTGRAREADEVTLVIFLLVNAAAAMRVAAPLAIEWHLELFGLSAACWSLAFALFVLRYGRMLVTPWQRKG
jgi:uncharacterized protein involved in response to NO